MSGPVVNSAWSCEEHRNNCRNPHGCHCREITDLTQAVKDKETLISAQMQMIRRLEGQP